MMQGNINCLKAPSMELIEYLPATFAVVAVAVRLCLLPASNLGLGAGPARQAARSVKPAPTGVPTAYRDIAC